MVEKAQAFQAETGNSIQFDKERAINMNSLQRGDKWKIAKVLKGEALPNREARVAWDRVKKVLVEGQKPCPYFLHDKLVTCGHPDRGEWAQSSIGEEKI